MPETTPDLDDPDALVACPLCGLVILAGGCALGHEDCPLFRAAARTPPCMKLVFTLRAQAERRTILPEHDLMLAAAAQIEDDWKCYKSLEHD